ncbi:MAG TPA: tryptophan transporter [Bacillota bacterium]|nr:tryptophan transporter [Bacillota bacterium]
MNTRVLIILSLFVGIGAVLHAIAPPILFGMRPDMLLSMMFLGILLFPKIQYTILIAIVTGAIAALTTTFPGGQIANIIDKPISAIIFLGLFLLLKQSIKNNHIIAPILTFIGTLISGSVFILTAIYLVGVGGQLGNGFFTLFGIVVIPAAIVNTIVMVILYPIVGQIMKRAQPIVTP